eukprot:jgi/Chrzof1/14274/Cz08g31260.t1
MVGVGTDDCYILPDNAAITDIIHKLGMEAKDYDNYMQEYLRYKKLRKALQSNTPIHALDPCLLLTGLDGNWFTEKPQYKYGTKPVFHLVLDDFQGSSLFQPSTKNKLLNFILRPRHAAALQHGGALGCSVWLLCQNYNAQGGGLPKMIRANCTHLCLWRTKDSNTLTKIAEEVAGEVTPDEFYKAYNYAVNQAPHDILLLEFPKNRFRRNWDELISF